MADAPFAGFRRPTYTQVPDEVFDLLMPSLSGAEFKVLCYIVRRTLGFKRDADTISLKQMCEGITRRDGTRLDGGTGLGRSTVVAALKGLEGRGIIAAERRTAAEGHNDVTTYSLRWQPDGVGQESNHQGPETGRGVGQESDPQQTEEQQTEEQLRATLDDRLRFAADPRSVPPRPIRSGD